MPPPSAGELRRRQFEPLIPKKLFSPEPDEAFQENFSAPPFARADTAELLLRTFELPEKTAEEAQTVAEPPPAEKISPVPDSPEKEVQIKEKTSVSQVLPKSAGNGSEPEEKEKTEEVRDTADNVTTSQDIMKTEKEPVKKHEPEPGESATSALPKAPKDQKGSDSMERSMKLAIAGFAIVMVLILAASFSNGSKYYIHPAEDGVEIWKGLFAPMEKELLVELPGVQAPETVKAVYTSKEALPLVFNYYIGQADALLDAKNIPDFREVRAYLRKAISFGTSGEEFKTAYARLKKIDVIILMNKADIAVSKGTTDEFKAALKYLNQAVSINKDKQQQSLIKNRIESLMELMKSSEAKQAEAPPEAPTEAKAGDSGKASPPEAPAESKAGDSGKASPAEAEAGDSGKASPDEAPAESEAGDSGESSAPAK